MAVKAIVTLRKVSSICALLTAGFVLDAQALTNADRTTAADLTAKSTTNACKAIGKFYWEVGDKNLMLGNGSKGLLPPNANTKFDIASASKWMFGAYLYKKHGNALTAADVQALTMKSGYSDFSSCGLTTTVGACYTYSSNDVKYDGSTAAQSPSTVNKFFYGGGHYQKYAAVDLALSSANNSALQTELQTQLGTDVDFTYVSPQPAGGVRTNATNYAIFLRKLLKADDLLLGNVLGTQAVCTYTGPTDAATGRQHCADSVSSPATDLAWHYSLGHWVEDDPVTGDGAFSSPGLYGFYPWIDAAKVYYGILSRSDLGANSYLESAACGALIRKAWQSGIQQ